MLRFFLHNFVVLYIILRDIIAVGHDAGFVCLTLLSIYSIFQTGIYLFSAQVFHINLPVRPADLHARVEVYRVDTPYIFIVSCVLQEPGNRFYRGEFADALAVG